MLPWRRKLESRVLSHLLLLWTEGPTWGCHGFCHPRVRAAAGLGGVRAGAKGGGWQEGLLGRTVRLLHLLWAQVDFDGPLGALQVYLQVILEEEEKPGHDSGRLGTDSWVRPNGWTPRPPTTHVSKPHS